MKTTIIPCRLLKDGNTLTPTNPPLALTLKPAGAQTQETSARQRQQPLVDPQIGQSSTPKPTTTTTSTKSTSKSTTSSSSTKKPTSSTSTSLSTSTKTTAKPTTQGVLPDHEEEHFHIHDEEGQHDDDFVHLQREAERHKHRHARERRHLQPQPVLQIRILPRSSEPGRHPTAGQMRQQEDDLCGLLSGRGLR
ncbi:hypothetical protein V8E36_000025 [Tilletia maclaganii]